MIKEKRQYNTMPRFIRGLLYKVACLRSKFVNWRSGRKAKKITDFFYSPTFVCAVGVVTLLLNLLGIDELTYSVLAVVAAATLVFCPDIMPALAVLVQYTVALSQNNRRGVNFTTVSYVIFAVVCAILGICGVFHLIVNFRWGSWRGSRLTIGFVAVSAGLITNGFFYDGYVYRDLVTGLKLVIYMFGMYMLVRTCVRPLKETLRYFSYICVINGLVVSGELFAAYFTNKPFIESGFSKDKLILGWGISNTIGMAIARNIPFCFYLLCTEKKHNWYYFVSAVVMVAAMVLTFARASLLFTVPVCIIGYVLSCVYGKNRKQTLICGAVAFVVVVAVVTVARHKFFEMFTFYKDAGFGDRGRFALWKEGLDLFFGHPVFGVGLRYKYLHFTHRPFYYFHNTWIQYLASGGIVGFITYMFHRMQTFELFTQKPTLNRAFLAISVGSILLISLLDTFVMYFPAQLYLGFALALAEHDLNRRLPFAYRRRGKAYKRLF